MINFQPRALVELFHLLFIDQLGRKIDKKLYCLKGGCNMRFFFNSIRYSEDIDLDIHTINKDTLYKNINQILNSAAFKYILSVNDIEILSISAPKQTQTTQRWKLILKSSRSALPLHTKIEFSRRKLDANIKFEAINPQILHQYSVPIIMTNHYAIQTMYEQKILALALRNETQSRDIFDLYVLINSGNSFTNIDKDVSRHIPQAIKNAESISYADFKGHVIAYLPENLQSQYDDILVWDDISQKVIASLNEHLT